MGSRANMGSSRGALDLDTTWEASIAGDPPRSNGDMMELEAGVQSASSMAPVYDDSRRVTQQRRHNWPRILLILFTIALYLISEVALKHRDGMSWVEFLFLTFVLFCFLFLVFCRIHVFIVCRYTLQCRSVHPSVRLSITFLNYKQLLHYCPCPTVHDCPGMGLDAPVYPSATTL